VEIAVKPAPGTTQAMRTKQGGRVAHPVPNFFIGFPLPDHWVERATTGLPAGIRTFRGEDIHITIAFLGACGAEAASEAWRVFAGDHSDALVRNEHSFEVELGRVEPFGPPTKPSSLSAVPVAHSVEAAQFIERHRAAIRNAAGLASEDRPARPHATIARIKRNAREGERDSAVRWALAVPPLGVSLHVGDVALFTWTQRRDVQLYHIIARRALLPAPDRQGR
jgi:2'-5' RNA ligase